MKTQREVIECIVANEESWVMGRQDKANEKRKTSWQFCFRISTVLYPTQPGYERCQTL